MIAATAVCLGVAGCVLVMDADFDDYHAAEPVPAPDGGGGEGGSQAGGAAGSVEGGQGGTAGEAGMGGDAGRGGTAGSAPVDASTDEAVQPTCDDGIWNQGEEKLDCGGPCPPCPGFTHFESFDSFPSPGPDGPYGVYGVCNDDSYVEGWVLTNTADPVFPQGAGYYALIDTTKLLYSGLVCDDSLVTPELDTRQSTQVTISFDTTFLMLTASHAEVVLVRDGTPETVWTTYVDVPAQRVTLGPESVAGTEKLSVLFRYVGEFDGYWMVDNIGIVGE